MNLIEAISLSNQADARAEIKEGDEVCITMTSRLIPFHGRRAVVKKATDKYLYVGWLKFTRNGKQVGERKSQPVHYGLYALTDEVAAVLPEREAGQ